MSEEKLVGHIGVDSGGILIVDPCYLLSVDDMKEWYETEYVRKLCGNNSKTSEVCVGSLAPMGIVSESGVGDGVYPVYATIQDLPGWGRRVTSLRVEFVPQEAIDELEQMQEEAKQ